MSVDSHGRWPWGAVAAVIPAWVAVAVRRRWLLTVVRWVAGLAIPILLSHQTEEWVRPRGFHPFADQRLLGSDKADWPLTERLAFHINVSVGWTSAITGLILWRRTPVPAAGVL